MGTASCHAGLLGAGTGEGSCAAAPFRATATKWGVSCPAYASCCTEYGYCRGEDEWLAGNFRDCNGRSNGQALPADAVNAENIAAANGVAVGAGAGVGVAAGAGIGLGAGAAGAGVVGAGVGLGAGAAGAAGVGLGGAGAGASGVLVSGAGVANGRLVAANGAGFLVNGANGAGFIANGVNGAGFAVNGAGGLVSTGANGDFSTTDSCPAMALLAMDSSLTAPM